MITHKIKNILILVMAILLLISGTLNFIQVRNAKQEQTNRMADNLRNQIQIEKHRALAESYNDRAIQIEAELIKQRDSSKVAQKALSAENRTYRKNIAILRPLVASRIDSVPDLRAFVANQDRLIVGQDSLITSLELSCMAQVRSFEEILRLNRAQINEQVSVSNSLQEQVVFEQGESRKWKKKANKRFSLGLSGGWGVMSTGGEIRTGAVIQAGLNFRLLRF